MFYWINIFSKVIIKLGNLYLKLNTCSIWTEKKSYDTGKDYKKNRKYKTLIK